MNNENSRFDFALRKASYREIEACFREFNLAYPTEDDCMVALIEAAAFDANSGHFGIGPELRSILAERAEEMMWRKSIEAGR